MGGGGAGGQLLLLDRQTLLPTKFKSLTVTTLWIMLYGMNLHFIGGLFQVPPKFELNLALKYKYI